MSVRFFVMVQFFVALHEIRYAGLDLILDAADAFRLLAGQVYACVQGVSAALVDLDQLLIREDAVFRYQSGTGGKVLLGSLVVSTKVVSVGHAIAIKVPIPCNELYAGLAVCAGQNCAVEISQHLVAVFQILDPQGGASSIPRIYSAVVLPIPNALSFAAVRSGVETSLYVMPPILLTSQSGWSSIIKLRCPFRSCST